jgi:hypothetical protein
MEGGQDSPKPVENRVETADGNKVVLFRYDNPEAQNKNPDSEVSRPSLVGSWFTDSTYSLTTHIRRRAPGGKIIAVIVPKDKLEEMRAKNHPETIGMDIENDNFIIPNELRGEELTFPLDVQAANSARFLFKDWEPIASAVDEIVDDVKKRLQ